MRVIQLQNLFTGLNNENKKNGIKSAFFVLTGYNERLPYCCDVLEPSYRPTPLPPPDPGNSTQFRGSRTLKQRHKGTGHIRPMSYFTLMRILFGATGPCCGAVLTDVSCISTVAMYKERRETLRTTSPKQSALEPLKL
jgi:hypothetical protein